MQVCVKAKNTGGRIEILSSKSELHRLMLLAALSKNERTEIEFCSSAGRDVMATADCIRAVGGGAEIVDNKLIIRPIKPKSETVQVCPNESGSTLRFILPIFSALGISYSVTVNGRLGARPLSPLYELMSENGVRMSENGVYPLSVSGKLTGNDFAIDGGVSSQFITGLLMALPVIAKEGKVVVTGDFQSASYVDVTVEAMRQFGATVTKTGQTYEVKCDGYRSKSRLKAGGDWSNAAAFAVAGAISGSGVTISGLSKNSTQGDRKIANVLSDMGAIVSWREDGLEIKKSKLVGTVIDAKDIPDLVPVLSVACAVAEGESRIINAQRLRIKESDRIKSVVSMLNALGARAEETEDGMIIFGSSELRGGCVDACNDHRIVMAASIAAAVCEGEVKIKGAEAITKSYPDFFEVIRQIGYEIKEND